MTYLYVWSPSQLRFSDGVVQFVKPNLTAITFAARSTLLHATYERTPKSNVARERRMLIIGVEGCFAFTKCSALRTIMNVNIWADKC